MSLQIGHKLAHYEILEPIGKGGMGEVYRARDGKLGRDVAIKVLPEEFSQDRERLARFKREAKVLASLNHPNIASIYGLEQSEDTHYLVLELVPGETLAERISRGPLPVDEALDIATKIVEALEEAHERGIVHRDLKPANIMLTPDDKVKVLDYGLAKAFAEETPQADTSMSPTLTRDATRVGVILGTAAYMSPEQAKGKRVDKRTDIFAFGAVLYEMLTARKAFAGEDVSEVLAAVIKSEPDWDVLPRNLPGRSRELLRRCLAKELRQRTPDIAVARQEIASAGSPDSTMEAKANPWRRPLPWVGGALLGASALWVSTLFAPTNVPPVTRFEIAALTGVDRGLFAISPDGSALVYQEQDRLWLRPLDELEARPLPGTEGGRQPFFSPDSQWLAFFTATELKKMSFDGSAPVTVASVENGSEGTWGLGGTIVFGQRGPTGLYRVEASGGPPEPFAPLGDHVDILYPHILPEGEWVLYSDNITGQQNEIAVQSLVTGERKVVLELDTRPHWPHFSETGYLLYAVFTSTSPSGYEILAISFDPSTLESSGPAIPILVDAAVDFRVSSEGTLVYGLGEGAQARFVWLDEDDGEEPVTELAPAFRSIFWPFGGALSPNGETLAVFSASHDIWLYDLASESLSRLTFDPAVDIYPLWSADGERVVFTRQAATGGGGLFWKRADGSGEEERLTGEQVRAFSWTLDRKTLIVGRTCEGNTCADIGLLSLDGDGKVVPLFESEASEDQATLSPDGRFIAYQSDESGAPRIYVRPFPDIDDGRWQISPEDGAHPVWAPDGTKLYYRARNDILSVPIETAGTFSFGKPSVLFENRPRITAPGVRDYSVSPDGERFMMVVGGGEPTRLIVVRNWFEELERLVPTEN